ncbi:MAG: ribokinase [Lawsonibacter sp.]|nr:ribokinase [Lawsonibacter sp.]
MRDKIVVIGSLNYDIILKSSRLPECGETMPVDNAAFSAGGKGANQAVQAAKLGVPTYMVGCVGEDAQGAYLVQTAKAYGVNTDHIRTIPGVPSGMGVISALEDGSVFASIVRGANYAVTRENIDAVEPLLQQAAIVILQMEIPMEINTYAIQKAKACGCKVLLNAAPAMEIPNRYLQMCDIIVVNEVEAAFYLNTELGTVDQAREGAARMARDYSADIIVTLGKEGAVVSDQGSVTFIPAREVEAIETTGAGDSFIGGVGYALMQNMTLTEACQFAADCSAITVCRLGAQDSMPALKEVQNSI